MGREKLGPFACPSPSAESPNLNCHPEGLAAIYDVLRTRRNIVQYISYSRPPRRQGKTVEVRLAIREAQDVSPSKLTRLFHAARFSKSRVEAPATDAPVKNTYLSGLQKDRRVNSLNA